MGDGEKLKIAVFVSGQGSNLQAIIDAIEANRIEVALSFVLSDVEDAPALDRARKHGINAIFLDPKELSQKEDYERAILALPAMQNVGLVCLAGFMQILSSHFLRNFHGKVMNIHPALLPSFPGLRVQRKALEHGVRFSGCTVHFVDKGIDTGPIIAQAVIPVLQEDTEEKLSKKILALEHQIYPQVIKWYASGRLKSQGHRVILEGGEGGGGGSAYLVYPPLEDES